MIIPVVGVTFEGRQDKLKALYEKHGTQPFEGQLVAEPENKHDANAVAVHADGEHIGYIGSDNLTVIWDYVSEHGGMPDPVAVMVDHHTVEKQWNNFLRFHAKIAVHI